MSSSSLLILPSPILKLQHALLPSKVLRAREHAPTFYSSAIFYLDSHLSPSRSWEHVKQPPSDVSEEVLMVIKLHKKRRCLWEMIKANLENAHKQYKDFVDKS